MTALHRRLSLAIRPANARSRPIGSLPFRALAAAALPLLAAAGALAAEVAPGGGAGTCIGACGRAAATGDIGLSPATSPRYGFVTTAGSEALDTSPLLLDGNSRGSGTETNGSRWTSDVFAAATGDTLSIWFDFVSTDGKGYDDYAWARLTDAVDGHVVAWLFAAAATNSSTGKVVPGDVLDRSDFDPDERIVDFDSWEFVSKTADDPVDWAPLGFSNGTCWKDNAPGCGYTGWMQSRYTFGADAQVRVELGVVNWGDWAYDSGLAFDYAGFASAVPEPGPLALWLCGAGVGLRLRRRRA